MRGAYYVAIAFLVAASSRTAAEFDQAEPQPAINNDIVTSGGTVNEMLPRRVLRGSRDLKDKLAVYANDEERTFDLFPNENNFAKALKPTITKTANVLRADRDDVMAKAAEAMKDFEQVNPALNPSKSKRQRIDAKPKNVEKQALHATSTSKNSVATMANNVPFVSAKRRGRDKPTNNAKRPKTQHDYRPASLGSSKNSAVVPDGQLNKQVITQKALKFDANNHPVEVEIRNGERQRIDPTPEIVYKVHAPLSSEKPLVKLASDAPLVLATRLKKNKPTVIIKRALNYIMRHEFRPEISDSSTTSVDAPGGGLIKQPIAQKGIELDLNKLPDGVDLHLIEQPLHLREKTGNSAHPAALDSQSVAGEWKGRKRGADKVGGEDEEKVHEAFLKAFNLPFHQYLEETNTMVRLLKWRQHSSPNSIRVIKSLRNVAQSQKSIDTLQLLRPDLENLLTKEELASKVVKNNLREAYTVKLMIMYELFYDFCHNNKGLVEDLPPRRDRRDSLLELLT